MTTNYWRLIGEMARKFLIFYIATLTPIVSIKLIKSLKGDLSGEVARQNLRGEWNNSVATITPIVRYLIIINSEGRQSGDNEFWLAKNVYCHNDANHKQTY